MKFELLAELNNFFFFVDGDRHGKGPWTVMSSLGDQHDTYDTWEEANEVKNELNKKYGKKA